MFIKQFFVWRPWLKRLHDVDFIWMYSISKLLNMINNSCFIYNIYNFSNPYFHMQLQDIGDTLRCSWRLRPWFCLPSAPHHIIHTHMHVEQSCFYSKPNIIYNQPRHRTTAKGNCGLCIRIHCSRWDIFPFIFTCSSDFSVAGNVVCFSSVRSVFSLLLSSSSAIEVYLEIIINDMI